MKARFVVLVVALLVAPLAGALPAGQARAYDPPGTYRVDSNADALDPNPGDNICGQPATTGTCTLRAALEESDGDGLHSTIVFANPMTITLNPALGPLVEHQDHNSTYIDASEHWQGAWPAGSPGVRIEGPLMVLLQIDGDWVYVYGIEFGDGGIYISGGNDNWIGGTGTGQRNVFLSPWLGVMVQQSGSDHSSRNRIIGNYFGTGDGSSLAPLPALYGVYLGAGSDHATVEDNLIVNVTVSADTAGIVLSESDSNTIRRNTIGLNSSRTLALPNSSGIRVSQSSYNTIGPGNVIAGNSGDGIVILQASANNTVVENSIGITGLGNGGNGVQLAAGPGNAVDGNTILSNGADGVYLNSGADNTVTANVIGGSASNGIHYVNGMGNAEGNYIGMDKSGADIGNIGYGVLVESGGNIIGGLTALARQWIGFNDKDGIRLTGLFAANCTVANNMVGFTPSGGEAINGHHGISVYDGGGGNFIGTSSWGNVVMGSAWSGIALVNASGVTVLANRVGTNGSANWGNGYYGIIVVNGFGNTIKQNEVAYSGTYGGQEGVRVQGATATGNQITANSIHDNTGPGIVLADGGNASLAPPVIAGPGGCGGPVSGTACAGCSVELFADGADEGRTFLATVTADAAGAWTWTGASAGPYLTATATDAAGNTSAFSAPVAGCRRVCLPVVLSQR